MSEIKSREVEYNRIATVSQEIKKFMNDTKTDMGMIKLELKDKYVLKENFVANTNEFMLIVGKTSSFAENL
jgi:hypothetical protein